METKEKYSAYQAAILEALAGAHNNETARKYGVDKGNLSRVTRLTREQAHSRLETAHIELEFWEEASAIVEANNSQRETASMTTKKSMTDLPGTLRERFDKRVREGKADECWEWSGNRLPTGYGKIRVTFALGEYGLIYAHRVAYMIAYGPIPEGLFVLHSCDNPPCCNPAHLRAATAQANANDRDSRGRAGWQRANQTGEKSPHR